MGLSQFHCVQFGGFQQNINGTDIRCVDRENGGQEARPVRNEWRTPCWECLGCVWITRGNFQALDDCLLCSVTREIVQAELMFSSRTRAGIGDSFQQRTLPDCVRMSWPFWFGSSCESRTIEYRAGVANWFPLHANSTWMVVIWRAPYGECSATTQVLAVVVSASLPVSSPGAGRWVRGGVSRSHHSWYRLKQHAKQKGARDEIASNLFLHFTDALIITESSSGRMTS